MNTESLKEFRDPSQKARKPAWEGPGRDDFAYRTLIAFDPSLSATGVIVLSSTRNGLTVLEAYKFPNPETGALGNEDNFRKAMVLTGNVTAWRRNCLTDVTNLDFVHEAPPIGGGRVRAPESALLAGLAIRQSMWHHTCLGMISPASHKNYICGNSKADKKEHHAALAEVAEHLQIQNYELITNEAKRDALSIALTYLAWEKRNERG